MRVSVYEEGVGKLDRKNGREPFLSTFLSPERQKNPEICAEVLTG